MLNKHNLNKFKFYFGITLSAIALTFSPLASITSYAADPTDVEVCADYREWRYKIENGKLYKALYNASTGRWETDWMYVCDWPPEE